MKIEVTEEMRKALADYYRAVADSLTPDRTAAAEASVRIRLAENECTNLVAEAVERAEAQREEKE